MIVQESSADGVTVRIHDDCCRDTDAAAVEQVLRRIAALAEPEHAE